MRICGIVSHNKKIKFGSSSQGLTLTNVSRQDNRNFIKFARFEDALNAKGCHPSHHSIFNVFTCFLSTGALTAFVPMSAVLCSLLRFSVRISPESTRSCNQSIGQCKCRIRRAPRLSMILLTELLSVRRTHCGTSSPKSITMLFAPNKIDAPLTPAQNSDSATLKLRVPCVQLPALIRLTPWKRWAHVVLFLVSTHPAWSLSVCTRGALTYHCS